MKTIPITKMMQVRITLMLREHTGNRKDTTTRVVAELDDRIGLADEYMADVARPVGTNQLLIDTVKLAAEEPVEISLTKIEARILLGKVDALALSTRDLKAWADPLAGLLEAAGE